MDSTTASTAVLAWLLSMPALRGDLLGQFSPVHGLLPDSETAAHLSHTSGGIAVGGLQRLLFPTVSRHFRAVPLSRIAWLATVARLPRDRRPAARVGLRRLRRGRRRVGALGRDQPALTGGRRGISVPGCDAVLGLEVDEHVGAVEHALRSRPGARARSRARPRASSRRGTARACRRGGTRPAWRARSLWKPADAARAEAPDDLADRLELVVGQRLVDEHARRARDEPPAGDDDRHGDDERDDRVEPGRAGELDEREADQHARPTSRRRCAGARRRPRAPASRSRAPGAPGTSRRRG